MVAFSSGVVWTRGVAMTKTEEELFDALDFEALADPKGVELRADMTTELGLVESITRDMREMERLHARVLEKLVVFAQHQADHYRAYQSDLESEKPKRYSKYSTRVRYGDGSLRCVWRTVFFDKSGKPYSQDIKMGEGGRTSRKYNLRQFVNVDSEEYGTIAYVEGKYHLIREVLESMRKLKSAVAEIERRVIKAHNTNDFKGEQ